LSDLSDLSDFISLFYSQKKKFKFNRGMVNCAKKLDKLDKSDNFRAKLLISWNKKVSNFMPKLSDLSDFLTIPKVCISIDT
jgi:hypothetical protein